MSCRVKAFVLSVVFAVIGLPLGVAGAEGERPPAEKVFRAGAFAVDITPTKFPVIVSGSSLERGATEVVDPLNARCLVLDDGAVEIAVAVVDSLLIPRPMMDQAKQMAHEETGIPIDRMLISTTHTHTAPSVYGVLGSDRDEAYAAFLPGKIAEGIDRAYKNLAPARIGWAMGKDPTNVFCRRFLMKPGTARTNPFTGKENDQAQMNPGYLNPNAVRRTGPADPDVAVVSIQTRDGRPLALMSNYSTHYAGSAPVSADYFAVFCAEIEKRIGAENLDPPFVAMLSNGTSGDANCCDFTNPRREFDRFTVGRDVAQAAFEAYKTIQYYDWVPLVMEEARLTLKVRKPTAEEVKEAKLVVDKLPGGKPRGWPEIYARETVILDQWPDTREIKLQAIRIGQLGITAMPNEVYGSTGLRIKAESLLKPTFNVSVANGYAGYLPPPDQHRLGGYTTWRARSSCLEEEAEPKIAAKVLELLNTVAERRRDETLVPSPPTTFTISIDQGKWEKWGFQYPATYVFRLPAIPPNVEVHRRDRASEPWTLLENRAASDFFNGVECVRFDATENKAYVSVGFQTSNTIELRFMGVPSAEFDSVARYYDSRNSAYTLSNDNWGCNEWAHPGAPWLGPTNDDSDNYQAALHVCRGFHLPLSIAINSRSAGGEATWRNMQEELDRRDFSWEPAVHGQTHPKDAAAYAVRGYEQEILGCRRDILERLRNIPYGQYVFEHILTHGYVDDAILSSDAGEFLFVRGFNWDDNPTSIDYSPWNEKYDLYGVGGLNTKGYDTMLETREPKGRYFAEDVAQMNEAFAKTHEAGGIFYALWHPDRFQNSVLYDPRPGIDGVEGSTLMQHLAYVANRKDVWYVANGWLYSYHYVAENVRVTSSPIEAFFPDVRQRGSGPPSKVD